MILTNWKMHLFILDTRIKIIREIRRKDIHLKKRTVDLSFQTSVRMKAIIDIQKFHFNFYRKSYTISNL